MIFKIEGISKTFNHQMICRNFSMTLKEGDVALLIGPSGSGKTTMLRMINHLENVEMGSVSIDDDYLVKNGIYQSRQQQKKYQQKVGFVFQDYQLFPHLTVWENILLSAKVNKIDTDENLTSDAMKWLQMFGIEDKRNAYPSVLSGGQKQRVAIIRAVMMRPKLLCFDEPSSALDGENTAVYANIVEQLRKKGMMILIVTHDIELVKKLEQSAQLIESKQFVS